MNVIVILYSEVIVGGVWVRGGGGLVKYMISASYHCSVWQIYVDA